MAQNEHGPIPAAQQCCLILVGSVMKAAEGVRVGMQWCMSALTTSGIAHAHRRSWQLDRVAATKRMSS